MSLNTITSGGLELNGDNGFFSYVMNIDLKRAANGQTAMPWPTMPKITDLAKPAATVFMYDECFDPVTEKVNNSPQWNSVNPADRQTAMPRATIKAG